MTGDENDRCVWNGAVEFLLKLKPVHSRQVDVRHHTIEILHVSGLEKFLRAGVSEDREAGGAELEDESVANPLLIFDYCDPDEPTLSDSLDIVAVFRTATLRSSNNPRTRHYLFSEGLRHVANTTTR